MDKLSLRDLPLKGMRVLMRVDFNVPLNPDHSIADDSRIRAALPSIEYILSHGASLILMSHLGRPNAKPDPQFSLAPCAQRLSALLRKPVPLAPDCIGPRVEHLAQALQPGQMLLLENLRFHAGEEQADPAFARALAKLGQLYVNDAFGAAHRAHASTALIATYFPHLAAAGFLMEKEMDHLSSLLHHPKRPFYAIIGGAKVSTKIGVIHNLLHHIDALFLGGGMTYTFLKAQGIEIGHSLFEPDQLSVAKDLLNGPHSHEIRLPSDLIIANDFANHALRQTISTSGGIPAGWQGMDIGPNTTQEWSTALSEASTVFWNGPLGVCEMPHFATGTRRIAEMLAHCRAQVVVGGGETVAAIAQMGLQDHFAHVSTGGGASLEYLEFGHLPGIDALSDKV